MNHDLKPILEIAQRVNIAAEHVIPYGHSMAKISLNSLDQTVKKQGKLILVSSITPTPLGEGKTVTTLGLSQGINYLKQSAIACIRQPSLGPVFGVKGGAAGGGLAQVLPMERLNLHLTGDIHAISAAHNLASAALDARLYHEQRLGDKFTESTGLTLLNIDKNNIVWPRVMDHNDRALRHVVLSHNGGTNGVEYANQFEITAASELMAILALSTSLADMRQRIGRIILAYNNDGQPITAEQLEVAGAMTVVMKEAIQPTLMQTAENTPVFIHAGPFANIAHGNSSILADKIALQHADYVVTEAGFGSDMGMEKFFNIKYRQSSVAPSCVVLVVTLRSLKANSGQFNIKPGQALPAEINQKNIPLLELGSANLNWHINNAKRYAVPVVIAINRFPDDSDEEIEFLRQFSLKCGAYACEISNAFTQGGAGVASLAEQVMAACQLSSEVKLLYPDNLTIMQKIEHLAFSYGAKDIELSAHAQQQLDKLQNSGFADLPICMAKTPLSISADPALKNAPKNFTFPITDLRVSAGAGFIRVYAGNVMTMPGLGTLPAYRKIDIDEQGNIYGLD